MVRKQSITSTENVPPSSKKSQRDKITGPCSEILSTKLSTFRKKRFISTG